MLARPHTLSLIVTHQCTAACDHCCFGCSPEVEKTIPTANLHKYIDQAAEIDSFRLVVFTGGECFLLGDDLDALVRRASGHKFMTRFVSNGYWALSVEKARKRLQKLVDAGLSEANFSTGDMHAKWVPPERVRYGAIAAAELGLHTVIMVELFEKSRFDFEAFVADSELRKHIDAGLVSVKLSPWMPFDGKEHLTYTAKYLEQVPAIHSPGCVSALRVMAINPDEHLIACCGLTLEEIEEVHIGDLKKYSIAQILARTPDDFVKIWIHLYGPDAIIRHAQKFDPTIERPPGLAHICDTCRFMYNHPRIKEVVMANPPENKAEILRSYYDSLLVQTQQLDVDFSVRLHHSICSLDRMRELRALAVSPAQPA